MDTTSKKLIQLIDTSNLELRMSAIRIITELGLNSTQVIRSLARSLREEPENLRILALRALTRLGARGVVDLVIPLLLESGSLREHAMLVVSAVGQPAVPKLCKLYEKADFHGKRSVASTLSQIGGRQAIEFLLQALPREPFELQKHITQCICDSLDHLQAGAQQPVYQRILRFLSSKKTQSDLQVLVAILIILGYFHGDRINKSVRKVLLRYAEKRQPREVRRHALVSYQRLLRDTSPSADQIKALEKLMCDEDWHNVAQHALNAFQRITLSHKQLLKLVSLLHRSPHFSVHIHIFERLRGHESREVIRAIIPFLSDSRFRVREAAETTLRSLPAAIGDLFSVMMETEDSEVCQRITSILREYPQEAKRRYADTATRLFMKLFDQNDGRYQLFFEFVQAIEPEPIRQKIYQKVRSLKAGRSKEKWIKIAGYLQLLWDHHLITPDGRYLFAIALIRQASKDLSTSARRANLGLRVMRALIYDDTPSLIASLNKDPDVGSEEIYYIGFHFMEEGEEMRPFAKALLENLIRKYPKSKFAGLARSKLELHASRVQPESMKSGSTHTGRRTKKQKGDIPRDSEQVEVEAPKPVPPPVKAKAKAKASLRKPKPKAPSRKSKAVKKKKSSSASQKIPPKKRGRLAASKKGKK